MIQDEKPVTSNAQMLAKALRQRQAYPRKEIGADAAQDWTEVLKRLSDVRARLGVPNDSR